MKRAVVCTLIWLCAHAASANADTPTKSLYDDARTKRWAQTYRAGNIAQTLRLVERDLRSKSPHPYAAEAWAVIHSRRDQLQSALKRVRHPQLKTNLITVANAYKRTIDSDYTRLLGSVRPSQASTVNHISQALYLAQAAYYLGRFEDGLKYLGRATVLAPTDFQVARWYTSYYNALSAHPRRTQLFATCKRGNSEIARFCRFALRGRRVDPLRATRGRDAWLKRVPRSAKAWRAQGYAYENKSRYVKAAAAFAKAARYNPFNNNWRKVAVNLLRLGKIKQSERLIRRSSVLYARNYGDRASALAVQRATVFKQWGDKGKARAILLAELKRRPNNARAHNLLAQLILGTNLAANALRHAHMAAKAAPGDESRLRRLLQAMAKAGQQQQALAEFAKAETSRPFVTLNFYLAWIAALRTANKTTTQLQVAARAAKKFPMSDSLQHALANAHARNKQPRRALQILKKRLLHQVPTTATLANLAKWAANEQQAKRLLTEVYRRYYFAQAVWQHQVAIASGKQLATKQRIWQQARRANPTRYWPFASEIALLIANQRYQQAVALADKSITQSSSFGPEDRTFALRNYAWAVRRLAEKRTVSRPVIDRALARLDEFRRQGGRLSNDFYHRRALLLARGDRKGAFKAAWRYYELSPDDAYAVGTLITKHASEGHKRVWIAAKRFFDRAPHHGQRSSNLAYWHTKWGGSPLVALYHHHLMKTLAYPHRSAKEELQALSSLGVGSGDAYKAEYHRSAGVGKSVRYTRWFNQRRLKAQKRSATMEDIDFKTMTIKIRHPDGFLEVRQDDPVTGRPVLRQYGASWVRLNYASDSGNLVAMSASSGAWIKLTYSTTNRIARMRGNDGMDMSFLYNAQGRPTKITLKGVGVLDVAYNADGKVSKASSKGGAQVGVKISSAFRTLLALTRAVSRSSKYINLPFKDKQRTALSKTYDDKQKAFRSQNDKSAELSAYRAGLALARHLLKNIAAKRSYSRELRPLLRNLIRPGQRPGASARIIDVSITAIGLHHRMLHAVHAMGVTPRVFERWYTLRQWLDGQLQRRPRSIVTRRVLTQIKRKPISVLHHARWLADSSIGNKGFWRHHSLADVLPQPQLSARAQTIVARKNGDVIVGTNRGLAVLHKGFWQWFTFDETRGRFTRNGSTKQPSSNVLALAEDGVGGLWIGTAKGLVHMARDYLDPVTRILTKAQGLPSIYVNHLVGLHDGVLAGTLSGLRRFNASGGSSVAKALDTRAVQFVKAVNHSPGGVFALVGTRAGVFAIAPAGARRIATGNATDAQYDPDSRTFILLRNNGLSAAQWESGTKPLTFRSMIGQKDVRRQHNVRGLARIAVDQQPNSRRGWKHAIAVLTDRGMGLYRDHYFEHLQLPQAAAPRDVKAVTTANGNTYALTDDGVHVFELGGVTVDRRGRVYDLVTHKGQKRTYIARERRIEYIDHTDSKPRARHFDWLSARHLACDISGNLLAAVGDRVYRYDKNHRRQLLFRTRPTVPKSVKGAHEFGFMSLLGASDGSIWASYGPSVFRWKNGKVREFNTYKDEKVFPARSSAIWKIVETIDRKIWIIASNEAHLKHNNVNLEGGVLEWNGKTFRRIKLAKHTEKWFITGYTKVSKGLAIVSTSQGFARHTPDAFVEFDKLNAPSYDSLKKKVWDLWMGTKGADIGGGLWLFGTAAGVVGYKDGLWFYPDRLNQMLPDRPMHQYGAKVVHAVATDAHGRVYAGTDRGLLVYDSGGGDAAAFLVSNDLVGAAIRDAEVAKARAVSSILLTGGRSGKLVTKIKTQQAKLQALKRQLRANGATETEHAGPSQVATGGTGVFRGKRRIAAEFKRINDKLTELMLKLEDEEPQVFKALGVKPLDLVSLHQRLKADQVIIQFLPSRGRLHINVVTKTAIRGRHVDVTRAKLFARARKAAKNLANTANAQRRKGARAATATSITDDLQWLYQQLLAPVEDDIRGFKHVFIVPTGPLAYLPFGALISQRKPTLRFAVQDHNFGYFTSMYMFQLMLEQRPSLATKTLVLADPRGDLHGARGEAAEIRRALKGTTTIVRSGRNATYKQLLAHAATSRYVHLATHGVLDEKNPRKSYLKLANGYELRVADAIRLPLKRADMVVLSACQSGLGRQGLEFATLARAFMHARAKSVVASLWLVPDSPTKLLMAKFYARLHAGDDRITALTKAQRALIATGKPTLRHPYSWSGFVFFGKP